MHNQQQNHNLQGSSQIPASVSHGGHEMFDAHEAISGLAGCLEQSLLYEQHIQDPELKAILQKQKTYLTQTYNTIVSVLQTGQEPNIKTQTYNMPESNNVLYGMKPTQPKVPVQSSSELNDQCISKFMMGNLKSSASIFTMSALEMTNPVMRRVFADSVPNIIEMAYEVFLYQNKHQYYQVPQLKEEDMQIYMNSFSHVQNTMPH
ncbi:spore coat protein [Oceanobacillus massiliensis]|uniref:spore coat protein n=1 Tax=Oceanobacillus massiliensis TaxID=1465765 RepID=UPI000289D914|nr:spore coat protein [Oceanobacillus massiliensis]